MGKNFYSPANTGIYMSLLLHPNTDFNEILKLTTITAVAVCQVIENMTQLDVRIKWVNDIYINNAKVAGILTEAITNSENMSSSTVIIGVGINITTETFPPEAGNAASIGVQLNKNTFLASIINEIFEILNNKTWTYMGYYREHSIVIGKRIIISNDNEENYATVLGIDDNGALEVQDDNGNISKIISGTIRIVE